MKISMAEVNKKANLIINEVARSGESVIVVKHGKPIAEIRPIVDTSNRKGALDHLRQLQLVKVSQPLKSVI